LYSAFVGYLGGATFEDDKLKGLLLGLGLAAAITLVVEGVRLLNRRWNLSARFGIRGMSAYRRIATEGGTRREGSPNTCRLRTGRAAKPGAGITLIGETGEGSARPTGEAVRGQHGRTAAAELAGPIRRIAERQRHCVPDIVAPPTRGDER